MTTCIRVTNLGPSTIVVESNDKSYRRELAPGQSTPSRPNDTCAYVWTGDPGKFFTVTEKKNT